MENTYAGFAPANYTGSEDNYICDTDNYTNDRNFMDILNNINENIILKNNIKNENNKLFQVKKINSK